MPSSTSPYPKLKGREVRDLGVPLSFVFAGLMDNGNPTHRIIHAALKASVHSESLLEGTCAIAKLPTETATAYRDALFFFLGCSMKLRAKYGPVKVFHVTLKSHQLAHLALRCHELNPRWAWCYSGESFMHVTKVLVQASCRGMRRSQVGTGVLKKWLTMWASFQIQPGELVFR